ncbi:hypothetical protein B0H98_1236 [Vreelandella songnenensis]|uniref:Uncharacterized protein n=1 Tax=Vreelandella songnenensis TaxID=1176243 RepID=A0A2T0UI79_9GAMM|nr:hypothetical protein [Halomonas songnenensis]PRY57578.1 hypothetical protein B0H98_1236 [Halomonas songnenensis]
MSKNFQNNTVNAFISIILIMFGIYILATGEIKNMQLGSERILPASAVIIFGVWIFIKSGIRLFKKKKL